MNVFTRPPNHPYRNLILAALAGVPAGSLAVSLLISLFESTSPQEVLRFIGDGMFVSFFGYLMMAPLLLLYGLPTLWLALRLRLAGPAIAFAMATLPGLCITLSEGGQDKTTLWIPLAISLATGVAFVALAYRGAAQPHQFRMG